MTDPTPTIRQATDAVSGVDIGFICEVCDHSGEPEVPAVDVIAGTDIPACADCAEHVSASDLR